MTTNKVYNDDLNNIEDTYDSSYEIENWDDLDIDQNILRGIFSYGFENLAYTKKSYYSYH